MLIKKYTVLVASWMLCIGMTSAHAATERPQLPHTLTLAGSCAACHGTNGLSQGGTPVLAGLDADYFVRRMHAYQQQTDSTDVMPQQARGLTADEIVQLAKYFAVQPRSSPDFSPQSQLKSLRQTRQ